MTMEKKEVLVRATRDFLQKDHGDWPMIAKGTMQRVKIDAEGYFLAQTNGGDLFGGCHIDNGWELVAWKPGEPVPPR
jgi:hypothetical protein